MVKGKRRAMDEGGGGRVVGKEGMRRTGEGILI